MTIQDERLKEGEAAVQEETANFLARVADFIGKKRAGCHSLKIMIDADGYIETVICEHQGKRQIRPRKK